MYATYMSRNPEDPVYNRIEAARNLAGLTRQELADKVGVHYQTIGYLEREEYSPSLVLALRISQVFNREISELFSLTPFKQGQINV
jgi:DNA-binding XRE family transcriptional regulator